MKSKRRRSTAAAAKDKIIISFSLQNLFTEILRFAGPDLAAAAQDGYIVAHELRFFNVVRYDDAGKTDFFLQ